MEIVYTSVYEEIQERGAFLPRLDSHWPRDFSSVLRKRGRGAVRLSDT